MSFLSNATGKRITTLVHRFTGEVFYPIICCPARSSVAYDRGGWVALDQDSIWLVNNYGARGLLFAEISNLSNISPTHITFETTSGGSFSIYPKTVTGGKEILSFLSTKILSSANSSGGGIIRSEEGRLKNIPTSDTEGHKIDKFCDSCLSIVPMSFTECAFCKGISFNYRKNLNYQTSVENQISDSKTVGIVEETPKIDCVPNPLMKVCSMCAEDIKFAAKKCRYCGTMLDDLEPK